jgi:flavin-dependent dehydrogenase
LIGLVPKRSPAIILDRRTIIESVECGWWYSSPLPDGQFLVTLFTDADLIPAGHRARRQFWSRQLGRSNHASPTLADECPEFQLRIISARTTRLGMPGHSGLFAVGDAAASFDPLYSQGITWAMDSGLAAADVIVATLQGKERALADYLRWIDREFETYLTTRSEYYRQERRWPHSPFWSRRQAELIAQAST